MSIEKTTKEYLKNFNGEEVEKNIVDGMEYAIESKKMIKDSLIKKGVYIDDATKFREYADKVDKIGEWKPEPDWWDIKSIVEKDDKPKVVILYTDGNLGLDFTATGLNQLQFYGAEKIEASDGQIITELAPIKVNDNGLKECSKGYKTWYLIFHLTDEAIFRPGYVNFGLLFYQSKWIHFYNVEEINCNSTFNINIQSTLEAYTSNKPVKIFGNNGFTIANSWLLKEIPEFKEIRKGNNYSFATLIDVANAPYIKKHQIMKMINNKCETDVDILGNMRTTFKYVLAVKK